MGKYEDNKSVGSVPFLGEEWLELETLPFASGLVATSGATTGSTEMVKEVGVVTLVGLAAPSSVSVTGMSVPPVAEAVGSATVAAASTEVSTSAVSMVSVSGKDV